MKNTLGVFAGLLLIIGSASADEAMFRVELVNGSVISGTFTETGLQLQTKYGVLDLPFSDIQNMTVGLDNRPDLIEKIDTQLNALKSPDEKTRLNAEKTLTDLGPGIRQLLESYLPKVQDPTQRKHLEATLAALKAQEGHSPWIKQISPDQSSRVQTGDTAVAGRLLNKGLHLKTSCGAIEMPINEIHSMKRIPAGQNPASPPPGVPIEVVIEFNDGSCVVGEVPDRATLAFKFESARFDLPIQAIQQIEQSDLSRLSTVTGDQLVGQLLSKELEVSSIIGDLKIPLERVTKLTRRGWTHQDFDSPGTLFTLAHWGAGNPPVIANGVLQLLFAGQQNQLNAIVFDADPPAPFNTIVAEFDFRFPPPAHADGFGFLLLPVDKYGRTGAVTQPLPAEEPNLPGAFGIGFDISCQTGDINANHISIHWNGTLLQQVNLDNILDLRASAWSHTKIQIVSVPGGSNVSISIRQDEKTVPLLANYFIKDMRPYEYRLAFCGRNGAGTMSLELDNIGASNPSADKATPGTDKAD